jgi:putative tryptophan/tyrosine transport system substrate-binding protein
MGSDMQRREFITLLGSTAATWPVAVRAQQRPSQIRRIGVLMTTAADDAQGQVWYAAFVQGLQQLGWEVGTNARIDTRWGAGDTERYHKYVEELIALKPDIVLATANSVVAEFQKASHTVPIVFVTTVDPVGSGLVASLARPGKNATGFIAFEFSLNAKLLELLKEVAPNIERVGVVRDPFVPAGSAGFAAIQTAASSFNVELSPISTQDADEIEHDIAEFARRSNSGLIVVGPPSSISLDRRHLILKLAIEHHLPSIYATLAFVSAGALISYGSDQLADYRHSAGYVDRILRGERPADLPVQAPTKYQLIVNVKTAKATGLTLPPSLLARADEVIE